MREQRETGQENALAIAVDALAFLAEDPLLLSRFLALSGLDAHELRDAALDPAFFAGLLDFFLAHERTLEAFCARSHVAPQAVVQARAALSQGYGAIPD